MSAASHSAGERDIQWALYKRRQDIFCNVLKVEFPNCAVLYLQSTKNTPDKMRIEARASSGILPIEVLVMRLRDYTLDDMISKDLLLLFPFYLFRFSDSVLKKADKDEMRLKAILDDYRRMRGS